MRRFLNSIIKHFLYRQSTTVYRKLYKTIISKNPVLKNTAEGEQLWLDKWRRYDKKLSPLSYRIFSRYCGTDINILPLEFIAGFVEPILTPVKYSYFYGDKNNFQRIMPDVAMPTTYLRNIDGFFFDEKYNLISLKEVDDYLKNVLKGCDKVVLKPTCSDSGRGVQLFYQNEGEFVNKRDEKLSLELLRMQYKCNYMLQECIRQSDAISMFNPTSINTIRIATYRDLNGEVHYLSAVMRIGSKGSEVDNAHAGGMFCGISEDGKVGNWVCNQYAERKMQYNGLDFENNQWVIPNYNSVKQFAIEVSKHIIHHDLIALDIALDENNQPMLVEFNVGGFSAWLFLMGGNSDLNKFSEEIMYRSYKQNQKLQYYLIPCIHKNNCLREI